MRGFLLSFVIEDKKMKITGSFVALLYDRPSGIYSLTGFSEKVFHQGRVVQSPIKLTQG